MMNKTNADLKSDVKKWLNRNDPTTVGMIPSFIALAEQEFSRIIKIPMNEASIDVLVNTEKTIPIPDDLLSPIAVYVNDIPQTRVNGWALFDEIRRTKNDGYFFAKLDKEWIFYPELKKDDAVKIIYHQDLTPMVSDTDTSPALKHGYDLMLYWSLKHASVYLRDPESEQFWSAKAEDAVTTMTDTFDDFHWSGSPLQVMNT